MKGLKVRKEQTEKARSLLQDRGALVPGYPILTQGDFTIIPVDGTSDLSDIGTIVEMDFGKRPGQSYKDYMDIPESEKEKLPSSFDILGSIAIIESRDEYKEHVKEIGEALLKAQKNIKTVLVKSGIHGGEFRTQDLEFVAGVKTKETLYFENDVRLKLDVEKVYFSPRLSTERRRIADLVKPHERVLVMFSGCAPYPCVISRHSRAKEIVGVEKNPVGHHYGLENIRLNKLKNVTLHNADVRDIVPQLGKFDRILMPLPKDAGDFLDTALAAAGPGTTIHLYDFEEEKDIALGERKAMDACRKAGTDCRITRTVKCGQYGPGKFRLCVDFEVLSP